MVIEHGESQELVATATLLVEAMNLQGSRVGTSCYPIAFQKGWGSRIRLEVSKHLGSADCGKTRDWWRWEVFFLQKEFDWLENFEGVSSLGIILNWLFDNPKSRLHTQSEWNVIGLVKMFISTLPSSGLGGLCFEASLLEEYPSVPARKASIFERKYRYACLEFPATFRVLTKTTGPWKEGSQRGFSKFLVLPIGLFRSHQCIFAKARWFNVTFLFPSKWR